MTTKSVAKDTQDIIDLIQELSDYGNCVFRGENENYGKVSSKLYRKYKDIANEHFSVLDIEKEIINEAKYHISSTASDIEVLTELQHYGGKTALIDFTYNILIALFFACVGDSKKRGRIIVFEKSKASDKQTYEIIDSTGKSPRVIFQSSVFIRAKQGYIKENDCEFIVIKKAQKQDILEHLRKYFHIETATIYNDIQGFIQNQDNYSSAEIEFYQGLAFDNNRDFEGAIKHYDKSIEINPQSAAAYNNRGNAKSALGKKKEAITDYDKAIEINPQSAAAYNNRGNAKSALGKKKEAITDYDKAIEINSQDAEAYYNRGIAKSVLGEFEKAITDYDKTIELKPKYAKAYYGLGLAKTLLGKYQEAITDYDKAIEINSQDAEAYYGRGGAKLNLGDKNGAIADFNQAKILFEQQGKTKLVAEAKQLLKKLKNDKST